MPTFYNSKNKWNSRNRESWRHERKPDSDETNSSPEMGPRQDNHHSYGNVYDDNDGYDWNQNTKWRARPRQRHQERTRQRNPPRWTPEHTTTDLTTSIPAIVAAVLEQLGHGDAKQQRKPAAPAATGLRSQTRSRSRSQSGTRSVRFSENEDTPTAGTPWTPQNTRSTNPDFGTLWRSLYKIVQVDHHLTNWEKLPKSINQRLWDLAEDIKPPDSTQQLRDDIRTILSNTGTRIQERIRTHFLERKDSHINTLRTCNPEDKEKAIKIAHKYMVINHGNNIQNLRSKLDEAASHIETGRTTTEPVTNPSTTGSNLKRHKPETNTPTPSPTQTTHDNKRTRANGTTPPPPGAPDRPAIMRRAEELTLQNGLDTPIPAEPVRKNGNTLNRASILHLAEQSFLGTEPKLKTPEQKKTPSTYLITDSPEDLTATVEPDDDLTQTISVAANTIKLQTTAKVAILADRSMTLTDPDDHPRLWELCIIDDTSIQGLNLVVSTLPDNCKATVVALAGPHQKLTTVRTLVEQIERLHGMITSKQLKFKIMGACISRTTPIEDQERLRSLNSLIHKKFDKLYISPTPMETTTMHTDGTRFDSTTARNVCARIEYNLSKNF